ncbi:uncharacterized protein LOC106652510 [Trichogramma pretiosum]|uniref:uncharacterized protein LOC106652510 n=1 Tax=Trichogramma pretiosum TaxID=7493 RepID=UPI0006C9A092|nr:uncharacterized protein LOC106652510 [Trichogramma pretiosum]XP_023315084.1 uncharacterized protein LOC106652510 [Trichogramma pretiosum]
MSDSDCEIIDETEDIIEISQLTKDDTTQELNSSNSSLDRYRQEFGIFQIWLKSQEANTVDEELLLAYFKEISSEYNPLTLKSKYSMLKNMIKSSYDIDIGEYEQLKTYLNDIAAGCKVVKTKVFTSEQIQRFLDEAPNEQFLLAKIALILGSQGACDSRELRELTMNDVELNKTFVVIKIQDSTSDFPKVVTLVGKNFELVKSYLQLRPEGILPFFVDYRNGNCYNQVYGRKISTVPKVIANWLKLEEPELYNSRSYSSFYIKKKKKSDRNLSRPEKKLKTTHAQ